MERSDDGEGRDGPGPDETGCHGDGEAGAGTVAAQSVRDEGSSGALGEVSELAVRAMLTDGWGQCARGMSYAMTLAVLSVRWHICLVATDNGGFRVLQAAMMNPHLDAFPTRPLLVSHQDNNSQRTTTQHWDLLVSLYLCYSRARACPSTTSSRPGQWKMHAFGWEVLSSCVTRLLPVPPFIARPLPVFHVLTTPYEHQLTNMRITLTKPSLK